MGVGDQLDAKHNSYAVKFMECDSAVAWSEGQSFSQSGKAKGNFQPQISTQVNKNTHVCMKAPQCVEGKAIKTWLCKADIKHYDPGHNRMLWDTNLNKIRSAFCIGMCVDADGDTPVLRDCSKVQGRWTRHGPAPLPTPVIPAPGKPGPMTGRYYLTWPLPQVNGFTVAGTGDDGYPDYFGNMNGELCPTEERVLVDDEFRCNWPRTDEVPLWKSSKNRPEKGAQYMMKRSEIVQRAIVWVANHFNSPNRSSLETGYPLLSEEEGDADLQVSSGHCNKGRVCNIDGCGVGESAYCPQFFHGGACCETVGNAWNSSTGNCFRGGSTSIRVPCNDMRPGDAISRGGGDKTCDTCHDFPHGDHIVVFRKWENAEKTWMTVFSNKRYSSMVRYSDMYCFKRKNIIEDVEPELMEDMMV